MINLAVMPLDHYDAACDALRDELGLEELITSDQLEPLIRELTGTGKTISDITCEVRTAFGYLFGDATEDGVVNEDDVTRIQQYVVMPNSTAINKDAADLNCDSMITNADAFALDGFIAKLGENQILAKITVTFSDATTSIYYVPVDKVEIEGTGSGTGKEISKVTVTTQTSSGNLLGDVNGDGAIDNNDSIAISRYIEGSITGIDVETADLNGDGVVDDADNVLLVKNIMSLKEGQVLAKVVIEYTDGSKYVEIKAIDVPVVSGDVSSGSSGTWTQSGDSTASASFAHDLGRIPTSIIVWAEVDGAEANGFVSAVYMPKMSASGLNHFDTSGTGVQAVVGNHISADSDSFTLSLPSNVKFVDGWTYHWEAI